MTFSKSSLLSCALPLLLACGDSSAPGGSGSGGQPASGQGGQGAGTGGQPEGAGGMGGQSVGAGGEGGVGGSGGSGGEPTGEGGSGEPLGGASSAEDVENACAALCQADIDCGGTCNSATCTTNVSNNIVDAADPNACFVAIVGFLNCQSNVKTCKLLEDDADDVPPGHPCYDVAQDLVAGACD
jgi:hypothetical protein